ncbi:hypothetical protein BCR32DRAFT_297631 [Anaeromyces robustus]|uniref:Uncharacterized protein n=1 Tax=Anaeromyces robustus TaxID=1754192 RepID=A0A1Y1VY79_9FUNG|nr:hypothetical protein BCR32DRAFT_297631 [Anaeromyces robustus]|eukprot:ORX66229.1 hypothetical protein BCR32DRAFT_297631 [Anaeromyces robustus]
MFSKKKYHIFGVLGGLAYVTADWLVFYGDAGIISQKYDILSKGIAETAPWRFNVSMVLSFISAVLLGIALFSEEIYISNNKHRKIFHYLNVFNLTTWSTLHIFLCTVFYTYRYMMNEGYQEIAINVIEAIGSQFMWTVLVCYLFIYPLFVYYFWLVVTGRTYLNRSMALSNVMLISIMLGFIVKLLPRNAFTIALNGSKGNLGLLIHFIILYIYSISSSKSTSKSNPKSTSKSTSKSISKKKM